MKEAYTEHSKDTASATVVRLLYPGLGNVRYVLGAVLNVLAFCFFLTQIVLVLGHRCSVASKEGNTIPSDFSCNCNEYTFPKTFMIEAREIQPTMIRTMLSVNRCGEIGVVERGTPKTNCLYLCEAQIHLYSRSREYDDALNGHPLHLSCYQGTDDKHIIVVEVKSF